MNTIVQMFWKTSLLIRERGNRVQKKQRVHVCLWKNQIKETEIKLKTLRVHKNKYMVFLLKIKRLGGWDITEIKLLQLANVKASNGQCGVCVFDLFIPGTVHEHVHYSMFQFILTTGCNATPSFTFIHSTRETITLPPILIRQNNNV